MPDAEPHVGGQVGGGIEDFVGTHAGGGGADDIADGVAARFAGGQADAAQLPQHLGSLVQRDVVDLDVLASGDVAFLQRSVVFRDFAEAIEHVCRDDAAGEFDPDHLDVGLALAVHALPQAEGRENGVVQLAGAEAVDLGIQALDLILHEGDDGSRVFSQLDTGCVDVFKARGLCLAGHGILLRCDIKNPTEPKGKIGGSGRHL